MISKFLAAQRKRWQSAMRVQYGADLVLMLLEIALLVGIVTSRSSDRTTPGFLSRNAPGLEWILLGALGMAAGYTATQMLREHPLSMLEWSVCALPLVAYVLATWWLFFAVPETNVAGALAYTLFAAFATSIKARSRKDSP